MTAGLLARLRSTVGERHVLTDPGLKASYETDWTRRFTGSAVAVVRPATTDEVASVLIACAAAGFAVVPQGGNTGLVGGSVPAGGEVVLSLTRLTDLGPIEPGGQVAAGAGVTLAALQAHAHAGGWAFGVDFGARDSATVGGMVATNAGGINVLRYGSMREQMIGLEAVLADGSVIRRLGGMVKDNTGYHLPSLLAGSEGTLAVITRVRLRLVPPLRHRAVALVGLPGVDAAARLTGELLRRLPSLLAAELFLDSGLDLVMRHAGVAAPFLGRHHAYLLAECAEGQGDPSAALGDALEAAGFDGDALLETDPDARHRLWQFRERHSEAIGAHGVPHKLDVSLPIARVAEFAEALDQTVERAAPGARAYLFGHLGDGNMHVNVLGPASDDERVDDVVLGLAIELGGSISAEHGIGRAKVRWLERDRGAADVAVMRAIKRAFDPGGILTPGVIFPIQDRGAGRERLR